MLHKHGAGPLAKLKGQSGLVNRLPAFSVRDDYLDSDPLIFPGLGRRLGSCKWPGKNPKQLESRQADDSNSCHLRISPFTPDLDPASCKTYLLPALESCHYTRDVVCILTSGGVLRNNETSGR